MLCLGWEREYRGRVEGIGVFVFKVYSMCSGQWKRLLKVRLRVETGQWRVSLEGLEQQPRMFGLKGALEMLILPEPGVTMPDGCLE